MNLWHKEDASEIEGAHANLSGNLEAISGNCTSVWGQAFISGNVTGLQGCLTGLTGSCEGLSGEVSRLRGNISEITGVVDKKLIGDVSGLHGDVSGVWGKADGLRGSIAELMEQGRLWLKEQTLTLEMFAIRFNLPISVQTTKDIDGGIFYANSKNAPMMVVHANDAAAAGSRDYVTVDYLNI